MSGPNILVIAVDGLRASALGAYGNTTYATPALDRFAAESYLLDWCYAPTLDLSGIYRALWHGTEPRRAVASGGAENTLPQFFTRCGYETTLISDEAEIALLPEAADFRERIEIGRSATQRVHDFSATEIVQLFEAACDVIENRDEQFGNRPRLVWVHSRGMYGAWDAPLELQRRMLDEGDPPPVESAASPDFMIGDGDDPDAAFRFGCAYAAQTMVLDGCWDGLIQAAVSNVVEGANWLVLLMGVRGFPLGEHRRIGGLDGRLYGEQLHVPWLIRFPDGRGRLTRASQLVSHVDVFPTLLESIGHASNPLCLTFDGASVVRLAGAERSECQDAIIASSNSSRAIRTMGWCLRQDLSPEGLAPPSDERPNRSELFVRPDDRWEANDVAKLCPDVVDELAGLLDRHPNQ